MRGSVLFLFLGVLLVGEQALAQKGDTTFSSKIRSVKLFRSGDPVSYPMITLNSNEQLVMQAGRKLSSARLIGLIKP